MPDQAAPGKDRHTFRGPPVLAESAPLELAKSSSPSLSDSLSIPGCSPPSGPSRTGSLSVRRRSPRATSANGGGPRTHRCPRSAQWWSKKTPDSAPRGGRRCRNRCHAAATHGLCDNGGGGAGRSHNRRCRNRSRPLFHRLRLRAARPLAAAAASLRGGAAGPLLLHCCCHPCRKCNGPLLRRRRLPSPRSLAAVASLWRCATAAASSTAAAAAATNHCSVAGCGLAAAASTAHAGGAVVAVAAQSRCRKPPADRPAARLLRRTWARLSPGPRGASWRAPPPSLPLAVRVAPPGAQPSQRKRAH